MTGDKHKERSTDVTEKITVTDIHSVLFVKKNNPPGKIDIYTPPNGMPRHEIIFRVKGAVITDFDGAMLHNSVGTVQFLPKGTGKELYRVQTLETGECIDVFFDTKEPLWEKAFCIETQHSSELRMLFGEINRVWFQKEEGYFCHAMSLLYKILSLVRQSFVLQRKGPHEGKIRAGIDYLNERFCQETIDYEEVAALCGMSYSYFRRLFSLCMGTAPAKYVTDKKIAYAKELLASGRYKVTEVAAITGFSDLYYFSHTFKKLTGYAPIRFLP